MKKCFIAALAVVFLVAAVIAIPTVDYLYRNPSLSLVKYQRQYVTRRQWLADLRTMISCVEFIWSVSHPPKLSAFVAESNQPPARTALSPTNPVAMSFGFGESRSNKMAGDNRLASVDAAPPLFVIMDSPSSSPHPYAGRASSCQKRYIFIYGSGRNIGGRSASGTIRPAAARPNPPQPPATPAAPRINGTNLQGV